MTEHGKNILFADSDERIRRLYSEVLTSAGYRVKTASNGVEALRRITEDLYDLVIADINIPQLDGIDLYMTAIERRARMRDSFLFMTEGPCKEIERRVPLPGIRDRCILKPFSITELLTAVESLLGGKTLAGRPVNPVKHEKDRRVEKRFVWEEDCRMTGKDTYNPKPCAAIADISINGVRIRHLGTPLSSASSVKIEIRCLRVKAAGKVVWANAVTEMESEAGLKLSLPVSYSSILTAVQGNHMSIPRQPRPER